MLGSLGRDRDFPGCNRVSGSVSRHGFQATGGCWVVTGVFLVSIELFFSYFYVTIGVPWCRNSVLFLVLTMS